MRNWDGIGWGDGESAAGLRVQTSWQNFEKRLGFSWTWIFKVKKCVHVSGQMTTKVKKAIDF